MVTTRPSDLSPAQRAPHFDSPDPRYYALLHYLRVPPGSGTAFYRQRSTGIERDRKSTRLNSSHLVISYAVFCLKKKNNYILCNYSPGDRSMRYAIYEGKFNPIEVPGSSATSAWDFSPSGEVVGTYRRHVCVP